MRIHPFKAVFPELSIIPSPDSFFPTVKEKYREYRDAGFFKTSEETSLYIYVIAGSQGEAAGVVCCNDIADIADNHILKHELTIAPKEQLMLQLIKHNQAMVKPVLLGYEEDGKIRSWIMEYRKRPVHMTIFFEARNETHTVWKISEPKEIIELQELFSHVSYGIIADGHHRSQAVYKIHQSDGSGNSPGLLSFYMSMDQLKIYDFYRVIELKDTLSDVEFITRIARYAKLNKLSTYRLPSRKHEMIMYIKGEWYAVRWKKKVLTKYKGSLPLLDNFLFSEIVLQKIIGVKDIRNDGRIRYYPGKTSLEQLQKKTNRLLQGVAFLFHPVEIAELSETVLGGSTLPPKSTWIEPRVMNGVIVNPYHT